MSSSPTPALHMSPREKDQLLVFTVALLAERRRARGLKLNLPEAAALISAALLEGARDGKTLSQVQTDACALLRRDEVMKGVAELLPEVSVDATFADGTQRVSVLNPIA